MEFFTRQADEFLAHKYPPQEHLLVPWLPRRGLTMLAGYRGTCKTWMMLGIGYAVATGGSFLGWKAPKPRKVLYIDGEMDPAELQERLKMLDKAARADKNGNPSLMAKNLTIMTHADMDYGIPDLALQDGDGRKIVEFAAKVNECELIMLDNLSCLFRSGIENDSESWVSTQEWLISLRRSGLSVLFAHHTGKPDMYGNVQQRGTSKREDVLNASILLNQPAPNGTFKLEFTKNRGFAMPDPMYVVLEIADGMARLKEADRSDEALKHYQAGMSLEEVAKVMRLRRETVSQLIPPEMKRGRGRPAKEGTSPGGSASQLLQDIDC